MMPDDPPPPAATITPDWCRLMARYNAWQNRNLLGAADTLDDGARKADRGAFFGSIHATLSHLLWGDRIWMVRFAGGTVPPGGIEESTRLFPDWAELKAARGQTDAAILSWAESLVPEDLHGVLGWHSGVLGREVTKPRALLVTHMFNHQTHHRGQVHAMLTAAGARPGGTDLFTMPDPP
jgi:uncharacterized damage-inducible protein DinB